MAWRGSAYSKQPDALVRLASRLLLAQAAASAAIGISYSRRNLPWLAVTIVVAVAVCGLAVVLRSGSHAAWQTAVGIESGLVAIAVARFADAGYMGGSLLAIIALGTLLHPAVAGSFGRAERGHAGAAEHAVLADGASEPLHGPAVS